MNQTTKKTMIIHEALHARDDVNRLHVSREEGERGLTSIQDSVDASIQRLENYTKKHRWRMITATSNNTDNTNISRTKIIRKHKWEGKQSYGYLKRQICEISHKKNWTWLRKGNLKRETESLLIAAQKSAIRTNNVKARINKTQENSRWRLCGDRDKTNNYIINECSKFAQKG